MPIFRLFLLCLILLVSACATRPIAPTAQSNPPIAINLQHLAKLNTIKKFSIKGRLGVVTKKQGFSGGIHWQHAADNDNIDVYSPVGGKVANIIKTPIDVTLTTQDSHSIKAKDAESLTETTLGFKLPLTGLSDWALGKPTASKIESSTWDNQGRLTTLKQEGWDISYDNYAESNGVFLPNKVVLKSEQVNLKLLIEKWTDIAQ